MASRCRRAVHACGTLAIGLAVCAVAMPRATAADGSWNVDAAANWSGTGSWLSGVIPGSTTATNSTDIATFGFTLTSGRVVTVDTNRNISGIIFSSTSANGYTLSGGNLLLSNGGVIQTATNNGAHTDNVNSSITIQGASGATATFTAGATSASSVLSVGVSSSTISAAATTGNTTTLTLNGSNTGANVVNSVLSDGSAGGRLALVKDGAGTWQLGNSTNANTFTGSVTLNAGTLNLTKASALGSGSGAFVINGGALDNTGVGDITISANRPITINNDFTYAGSTTRSLNLGTGAITLGTAAGTSRTITVTANTLTLAGAIGNGTTANSLVKAGAGRLTLGGSSTFTGPVTINSGTLQVTSQINNGGVAGALGAAASDAANLVINGATLELNMSGAGSTDRGITFGTSGGTIYGNLSSNNNFAFNGPVVLSGSGPRTITLRANASNRGYTLAGNFADAGGATSIVTAAGVTAGASSWTLNGSVTMTGGLTVGDGTFLFVSGTTLSSYSGGLSIGSGAEVSVRTSGTVLTNITNNGRINAQSGSPNVVYAGVISGTGQFYPSAGNSSTTLSNTANSYTGTTAVQGSPAATLSVMKLADGGQNSSIGASSNAASNLRIENSILTYLGSGDSTDRLFTVGGVNGAGANIGTLSANGSGAINFTNTGAIAWQVSGTTGSLTLSGTNTGNNTFAPAITNNGASTVSLTKSGGGTWVVTGSNSFSGQTTISLGRLVVSSLNSVSGGSATSNLGAPQNATDGTIVIAANSANASSELVYAGSGETSDRPVLFRNITGAARDLVIDQSGSGLLKFTTAVSSTTSSSGGVNLVLRGSTSGTGELAGGFVGDNSLTGSTSTLLRKEGSGTWIISGSSNYRGSTTVSGGVLRLDTAAAVTGTAARPYTVNAAGVLAAGYALDQALLDKVATASAGVIALAAGGTTSTALNFSSLAAASLGAVGSGTQAYTGTLTPNGTTYRIGGGGGTLDFQSLLSGSNTLTVGGNTAGLGGTVILSRTDNSYTGKTTIANGTLEIASLAIVGGGNSSLGAPTTSTNGTIDLGTGSAAATLRYVGSGHTSDRVLNFAGTGNVTIEAIGSGPLVLTGTNTDGGSGTRTFTLNATGTSLNQIGPIAGNGVSVNKTGSGLWRLTGNSSYTGQLKVLDGTIVVGGTVGEYNASPVGNNTTDLPIIGDSAATSGTAAFLAEGVTISRGFSIASSGSSGSQIVVIGGVGTGTTTFFSGMTISVGRDITLQASNGGTAEFNSIWAGASGTSGPGPDAVFTVGSASNAGTVRFGSDLPSTLAGVAVVNGTAQLKGSNDRIDPVTPVTVGSTLGSASNAGTVRFGSDLPSTLAGVAVVNGTAQLNGSNDRIDPVTPVTVGSTHGSATLDLDGLSQSLSRLTFAGNSGSVTTGTTAGGTLRLANSGSVAVSGTGHVISSLVTLDASASFNVDAASRLTINSTISEAGGAQSLTKLGTGILNLTGSSSYTGATTVSAGSLLVNGGLGSTAVTVQSGGLLGGSGTLLGSVSVLSGGTFSPGNSPGLLSTGSLTLAGTTLMEIDGLSPRGDIGGYDAANVSGLLSYGGSLLIDFGSSITSAFPDGTEFNLFDFTSHSGQFAGITTPNDGSWYGNLVFAPTGSGDTWKATKDSQTLEFTHSTGVLVVVPEPGALALAGIGIAAAAWAYRRRRS